MNSDGKAVKLAKEKTEEKFDSAVDKTANLKGKVSDNISNIADKIHQGTDAGKSFLDSKTEKTNELAHQVLDKAGQIGHQAADVINNSSEYIRNFEIENAKDSVKTAMREKPEFVLIAVGILGLAVGYLLGSKKNV